MMKLRIIHSIFGITGRWCLIYLWWWIEMESLIRLGKQRWLRSRSLVFLGPEIKCPMYS
jgi:hypothetical protein